MATLCSGHLGSFAKAQNKFEEGNSDYRNGETATAPSDRSIGTVELESRTLPRDNPSGHSNGRSQAPPAAFEGPLPQMNKRRVAINVLTYKLFLRPILPETQDDRAPLTAGQLQGYDVLLLQEAFSDHHRKLLL